MGIQFSALDTTRTRETFRGDLVPVHVDLPERWEIFGFHVAGAMALLGLLESACTLRGRTALAGLWADHQVGAVSIVDARRSIMLARARFDAVGPRVVAAVDATFGDLSDEPGGRVISGFDPSNRDLARRLGEFAAFVEAAAAAGADRVVWS